MQTREKLAVDLGPTHIRFTRLLQAPRRLVWHAWTQADQMRQWFAPRPFTVAECSIDLLTGGLYRVVMQAPDGRLYPMHGTIVHLQAPERLTTRDSLQDQPEDWKQVLLANAGGAAAEQALVSERDVQFEEVDGQTRITITVRFATEGIRDAYLKLQMAEGWAACLDQLEETATALA